VSATATTPRSGRDDKNVPTASKEGADSKAISRKSADGRLSTGSSASASSRKPDSSSGIRRRSHEGVVEIVAVSETPAAAVDAVTTAVSSASSSAPRAGSSARREPATSAVVSETKQRTSSERVAPKQDEKLRAQQPEHKAARSAIAEKPAGVAAPSSERQTAAKTHAGSVRSDAPAAAVAHAPHSHSDRNKAGSKAAPGKSEASRGSSKPDKQHSGPPRGACVRACVFVC
jgi:hypothetical protein